MHANEAGIYVDHEHMRISQTRTSIRHHERTHVLRVYRYFKNIILMTCIQILLHNSVIQYSGNVQALNKKYVCACVFEGKEAAQGIAPDKPHCQHSLTEVLIMYHNSI